ncbi:hypothetical protein DFH07DRAFT_868610 [Mycena maculata]|uniref:Uncharacterized protein n=1 Tax=Mycena maculata TaxID=230809 RepID=A0AAD7J4H2_9AGAR|nr:hypothetical protein DFH07DRAFT_868610 [Mycena maculata]
MEQAKIPLPKFLKVLTSNNAPMAKAMAVAGKIYKDYNTPARLSELDEVKLLAAGIDDKETRKMVMSALRKAGYGSKAARSNSSQAGPSQPHMTAVEVLTTPTKRKRKKIDDVNEFLPAPKDESAGVGNLEFSEVLDEDILKTKSTVVNRAPLMTAWSTLVAERLGFQREEALSIASVFTELNAVSKGVSMGIYKQGTERGMEASKAGSQPFVDLMGRSPLFQTQNSQWRALSNGTAIQPSTAFSYISRALRQTTPHIIGALRLLVESFTPEEINAKAWGLYAEFRPEVNGWGERAEVKCEKILGLRKPTTAVHPPGKVGTVIENSAGPLEEEDLEPPQKRQLTLEEYEAALDQDSTFDGIDLDLGTDDKT